MGSAARTVLTMRSPGSDKTMERVRAIKETCLEGEPAFCTTACPFHLDVRDFVAKMQRGSFNLAYRAYLNAVGFPGIVTALCDEPCKPVCPRGTMDGAIAMRLLEKAAIDYARNTDPNSYNLPPKNKRVAIVGAGISGLACALRLAAKKYDVTVYERSDRIGGRLWELLPSGLFLKDITQQFQHEEYTLCLNTEIGCLTDLDSDAIYVATGAGGADFGLERDPNGAFASTRLGVFLGGSLMGSNSVQSIADGLHASGAIERYIKAGGMNHPYQTSSTKLVLDPARIAPSDPVLPANGVSYTREEAVAEANRCLKCACDACMRYCDLVRYFKKYPTRIEEEVEVTVHPGTLDGAGTVATRLISTCNQCGLCKEVCPQGIDVGDFLLQSHRVMRTKGAMPWAFHDFWLRDMAFTNGPAAQLARVPAGYSQSSTMFFPGCQLGASDPRYVTASYRWLLAQRPDTALMLNCCGAPAEWAGDQGLHGQVIAELRDRWAALGKPTAVFACPTCKQMFGKYLPEIEGVFLYDLFLHAGVSPRADAQRETVSVFDPCASREEPGVQQAIRALAGQAGFALEPLSLEKRLAACCSWGGQVKLTHPPYARYVIEMRIAQSEVPYIAYCANCRDILAAASKPCYHILDVVFGLNAAERVSPTITERKKNRVRLKCQVLSEFWKEETEMAQSKIKLHISPQLRQKLDNEMILESEIEAVIEYCESSGRKVLDPESGHFSGHLQIGKVTYWAEYLPVDEGFDLVNAYSHRMSIEEA
jgi:Fe-S oxidoreductase